MLIFGFTVIVFIATFLPEKRTLGLCSTKTSLLHCFSFRNNFKELLSVDVDRTQNRPVHGFKAITAVWVCSFHLFLYAIAAVDNVQYAFSFPGSIGMQFLLSSTVVVDIFVVMRWFSTECVRKLKFFKIVTYFPILSSFVLSYNFFEKIKKGPIKDCSQEWFDKIKMRFLRLVPSLWLVSYYEY